MIVPIIITATGLFFFYSATDLANSYAGVILAHATLGIPFVIITVTATLVSFDHSLTRAAANLGASPSYTFFKITLPLILPGVISGALFAFVTSFDEVVVVLFIRRPRPTDDPTADVERYPRTNQPGDSIGCDAACHRLYRFADDHRAAAQTV